MTTGQIEKRFPSYALTYIRFLAGERDTFDRKAYALVPSRP